jgi:steroid delta-isomerase-like uncharacterized protein
MDANNNTATLAHRWFEEVWNKGREEVIGEMLAPDARIHGLKDDQGNELVGQAGFIPFFRSFRSAFPDINVLVEDTIQEGDKLVALCTVTGTHTGDGIGIAPTNKHVSFTGTTITIIKDGKLVEGWNHFDFLSLYQQLGLQLR